MVRNLYLAIIILFVIVFLYILKNARHDINTGLIHLVILTLTMVMLISLLYILDYNIPEAITNQYNLTPKNIKVLIYIFIIITYISIIQIPIKKLYNKDIELISPPPGEKGKRGNRGKQGESGYCSKCGTGGDMCYKKILYNVTITYNWWRKFVKKLPLLPDSYIIKNEYLKSKIKNHCSSDEFSKILKKFGSNDMEKKGAYDYMFRMWTIWILIILTYDKGRLFLESEQLTEIDFVNMITDVDKERNSDSDDWIKMFIGNNVSIKKSNVDCDIDNTTEACKTGIDVMFFDKGVPDQEQTPFDEIKKYSAWYWGSKSNSKPIVEIRTDLDNMDNDVELCKTCNNGCENFIWTNNNKIKIKKTNNFYTLFSTDNTGQLKSSGDVYTPFQPFGKTKVTFLRPYEYVDNEEHPKFRNYKPVGDVLINSSELDYTSNDEQCEPNNLKYTRKNIKKIVKTNISSILVSGDVVHPDSFDEVYTSINKHGINKYITAFTVWKPIPPSDEYIALGYVIDTNPYDKNVGPIPPSTDIMVCVPKIMADSISDNIGSIDDIWSSNSLELDGNTKTENITLQKYTPDDNDLNNSDKFPLNTFINKNDNDIKIKLGILNKPTSNPNSKNYWLCNEYNMYKNAEHKNEPKNECSINNKTKKKTCEANPKCAYDDKSICDYKKTNITNLLNYSILKIYK